MDRRGVQWRTGIPRKQVAELGLSKQSSAAAILADGRSVELETFACLLDWFGNTYETQIAASDGDMCCWQPCCWMAIA